MAEKRSRRTLAMRDIADGQLVTADHRDVARVADVALTRDAHGDLVVSHVIVGPEALAGRISSHLRPLAHVILRGRFEHWIPIGEVEGLGPEIKLRHEAKAYEVGDADTWVADHILRFIPFSGHE